MKKIWSLVMTLVLILSVLPAAQAVTRLPDEVEEYFYDSTFNGCRTTDSVYLGNYLFVSLVDTKGTNVLFGFRYLNGSYHYQMRTSKGVPQGGELTMVGENSYFDHKTGAVKYNTPTLALSVDVGSTRQHAAWYCLFNGTWTLMRYINDAKKLCVTVGNHQLTYYSGNGYSSKQGTAEGDVQRDLRYVSLSTIPTSLASAREHLTTAPTLPSSAQLKATGVSFTGGKKYEVYTAPSTQSLRSGNGKARVSTNGWIQVFGTEDGFAMIQYSIDAEHYRIGYISSKALPKNSGISALEFDFTDVTVNADCSVTDDPFYSQSSIAQLEAGDSVIYLASIGDWAYVESVSGGYYRGFVPLSVITYGTLEEDSEG